MSIDLADFEETLKPKADYAKALSALQKRLAHILVAHIVNRRKSVILFEGWDASGKGGAIQRLCAEWDPRHFEVYPISAPTEAEKSRHFLWRFWTKLPAAGEIAVFDRSWYGRVLVERVESFATESEWRRGYDEINEFEAQQTSDGTTIVKIFMHVTQEVQDERLKARLTHKWKHWKVTADDFRNRDKRPAYLKAMHDMFEHTNTRWAPWHLINGNDKKSARLAVLSTVVEQLEAAVPLTCPPLDPMVRELAKEDLGLKDEDLNS